VTLVLKGQWGRRIEFLDTVSFIRDVVPNDFLPLPCLRAEPYHLTHLILQ
jgi:hypothetical protein